MKVKEQIEVLKDLIKDLENTDQDKEIVCHIVAKDNSSVFADFNFKAAAGMSDKILLTITHPQLDTMKPLFTAFHIQQNNENYSLENIGFTHSDIEQILIKSNAVILDPCCNVPGKYCGNDVWKVNMEGLVKLSMRKGVEYATTTKVKKKQIYEIDNLS